MPKLEWIGKDKVMTHHLDVPYRILDKKYHFPNDNNCQEDGNMIIHGDNLEALKALLPKYEGGIHCIYIDPPYNTGNEKWVYNDNVNDPHIKKWLGEVVGAQGDDLSRDDKWLCMMYPRLKLLKQLLSEDGVIFISIDDNAQAMLKLLCDEIFGANNFIANCIWQKKTGAADARGIATITEYILCYCGNIDNVDKVFRQNKEAFDIKRYRFTDEYEAERGPFYYDSLDRGSIRYSDSLNYCITSPEGTPVYPNGRTEFVNDGWTWKWSEEKVRWGIENGFISVVKNPKSPNGWSVKYKIYLNVDNEGNPVSKSVPYKNLITDILNADAAELMKQLFGTKVFDYSKPLQLIEHLLSIVNIPENGIVLDSFAGSGTTGHAVLDKNQREGTNIHFILVELCDYAETVTAERVRRVISGFGSGNKERQGTNGSFSFYELGEKLFNDDGDINADIDEEKVREYIFYAETRRSLTRKRAEGSYLLDTANCTGYYFFYEPNKVTTFGPDTLKIVSEKADSYVVYADKCTLSEEYMLKNNIVFKKIPRDIKHF